MLADVRAVMYKEWKEQLAQLAKLTRPDGGLPWLFVLAAFGIVLPVHFFGREWIQTPMVLVSSAVMPFMFVAASVADSFAGERERHTLETLLATRLPDRAILLGKMLVAVCYGAGLTLVVLVLQLVSVNVAFPSDRLMMYPGIYGLGSVPLVLTASGLAASAGTLVSLRAPTVQQAFQTLTLAVMLMVFIPGFGSKLLPAEWILKLEQMVSPAGLTPLVLVLVAVMAMLDLVLFIIATIRFQRARLILD